MSRFRKVLYQKETLVSELATAGDQPIARAVGMAIITNPFASRYVEDLSDLFDLGGEIGETMMPTLTEMVPNPVVSYGKAAVVGVSGEFEHGGACIHPKLGRPMREAIGGGKAVIPSNVKVATAGTSIDVPLGHKDDPWSFDHFDTVTVSVPDAPRPDEIVVIIALADGGRLHARCGKGPVTG